MSSLLVKDVLGRLVKLPGIVCSRTLAPLPLTIVDVVGMQQRLGEIGREEAECLQVHPVLGLVLLAYVNQTTGVVCHVEARMGALQEYALSNETASFTASSLAP